ncbi:MAG: septum formation inhibitor Maf [Proteobacteria bacterium]|nr:septum formation inhibitor Maf [Pseudomonadota bacterium]
MENIILASASPRRQELLSSVGIKFRVEPSNVDEEPIFDESPQEHVSRLASAKAKEVAGRVKQGDEVWVLGADTIVIIDGELLGKPEGRVEALHMLKKLSGRMHKVITGYSIYNPSRDEEIKRAVETTVKFKDLTDDEITGYVASGEPMDKAGAYAIQGLGAFMVEEIKGSYSNVVGLPICQVVNDLEEAGAVRLFR